MKRIPLLPPTYLLISVLIMAILHFFLPAVKIIPFPWNMLGQIPFISGFIMNLIADKAFKDHKTTVKPFAESTTLITNGAYRISRNPMYLGFVLILLGVAIFLGSLTPYIVVLGFVTLMDIVFIRTEEQMLQKTFSGDWMEYKKKVRRWI